MRTLLIDDETAARSRMRRLLQSHSEIQIVAEAHDGLEGVRLIEKEKPDLVFLDIEMPGLNGFEVLRAIDAGVAPFVIFVTGYDQHALAAFQANALAYVLKPVDPEQLEKAVDRAQQLHRASNPDVRQATERVVRTATETFRQVVGRKGDRLLLLRPEQILWFQVEAGIVRAITAQGSFWVNFTLAELEQSFAPDLFFRARREILVNLGAIRELRPSFRSGFTLVMANNEATEIALSERQVPLFRTRVPGL